MLDTLVEFIENFAKEVAELGYSLRTENIENINKISEIAKSINDLSDMLSAKPNFNKHRINLSQYRGTLLSSYTAGDAVTLADTLEYELLNEIEEILEVLDDAKQ